MENKGEEKTIKLKLKSENDQSSEIPKAKLTVENIGNSKENSSDQKKQSNEPVEYYDPQKMAAAWGSKVSQISPQKTPANNLSKENNKNLTEKASHIQKDESKKISNNSNPSQVATQAKPQKVIDKQHVSIEKIFKVSLVQKENFLFLKEYSENLSEKAFRLNDLDSIIMSIITDPSKSENVLGYLLETYYRAYEMIEKKFKAEFDESFQIIRKIIVQYSSMILNSPENFELYYENDYYKSVLRKFYTSQESEIVENLILDFAKSNIEDEFKNNFLNYYFDYIYDSLFTMKNDFFNSSEHKKHLRTLTRLIGESKFIGESLFQYKNFLPKSNGYSFQYKSFLGLFFSLSPIDTELKSKLNSINTKNLEEAKKSLLEVTKALTNYIQELTKFTQVLLASSNEKNSVLSWFYEVVNLNLERKKTFFNALGVSNLGFLLNIIYVLSKVLTENKDLVENYYGNFAGQIETSFIFSKNIIYDNFEKISNEKYTEAFNKFNLFPISSFTNKSSLYFIINALISLTSKTVEKEYLAADRIFYELYQNQAFTDPKFQESVSIIKSFETYLKNYEFCKSLIKINVVNIYLFFSLNNQKYTQEFLKNTKITDSSILENFENFLKQEENPQVSCLPTHLYQNVIESFILIRITNVDYFIKEMTSVKIIAFFAIIYSSNSYFIVNPHYRSELLELISFIFSISKGESKIPGMNLFTNLLQDHFISNNIINSLMKSFNDAEKLGTPNQFYQKFSNRSRVLNIILNILLKHNKTIYTNKIIEFSLKNTEASVKMINLLMNDLTYLNDESIEKLKAIKEYEELIENKTKYNSLDIESKKTEDEKFKNNDRIAKAEISLLNQSFQYMIVISQCSTQNFFQYNLAERLAHLLNYSLSIFATKKSSSIHIKNKQEYNFDPKFILSALVQIYISFKSSKEFLEFVVKDGRSFKIDNFIKVVDLYEKKKVVLKNPEDIESFKKMIQELKYVDEDIKSKEIDYDDAPNEFIDPITSNLMDDPVILPSSKITIDRLTIEKHLLSDLTDPFNRQPLKMDMLIPNIELKKQIEEYKLKKINKI